MAIKVLVTADQLKQLCPQLNIMRINNLVAYINTVCPKYGIDTADIFHEFIANLCEESACFTRYEESLNYSTEALITKFARHRISIEDAYRYGRGGGHSADQKMIANIIYGGEWGKKHLGNTIPGDGWMMRGSGPSQITGRGNFKAFTEWMKKVFNISKTPEEWAQLLRSSDEYGIHSACWLFAVAKKLIDEAERDEMKLIVQRINGGLTNYSKRMEYYEMAKKIIV